MVARDWRADRPASACPHPKRSGKTASTALPCLPPWVVASWSPKTWAKGSPVQVSTLLHKESESDNAQGAALKKQHQGWPGAGGERAEKLGMRLEVELDRASKGPPLPLGAQAHQAHQALQGTGKNCLNLIGCPASQSEKSQADQGTKEAAPWAEDVGAWGPWERGQVGRLCPLPGAAPLLQSVQYRH